ncbi:MAG: aspartate aminotransferase family protein [Dehalococcoidia bacterium]|jgi:4-aminobutyrate aminotransferase-like enzyme|nr:aspartate aminotransferase family protein [Dehalococcoidales bacterium]MDP7674571.1 aspartate aminotransferase family protein [Dehalococcoidia bacterium]|tara:strand:+ start:376 stop:1692 length:1317 start_codon:yes stop_codon:yes gene_type:complete
MKIVRFGMNDVTKTLTQRRQVFADNALLFYDEPVYFTRAQGVWMYDANDTPYLDAYNNTVSVGHCNVEVVEAITRQASTLNSHTRYLYDTVLDYAEELLKEFPEDLSKIAFTCTGTEANELAMRIAKETTGGDGFIVVGNAYHGCSNATADISPYGSDGIVSASNVRALEPPNSYRLSNAEIEQNFTDGLRQCIKDVENNGHKFAALIIDATLEANGIFAIPTTYLRKSQEIIREAGGLFIADEVQGGFARMGDRMWSFERHNVTPDLVTVGKPMANGLPMGGVIGTADLINHFFRQHHYFNTFGGNAVCAAAGQATLRFIQRERLLNNARSVGKYLFDKCSKLMDKHEAIGHVRGAGLFIGIEFVEDRSSKKPAPVMAKAVMNSLRHHNILTGLAGQFDNVLKIRPPLIFDKANADQFLDTLNLVLSLDLRPVTLRP